MPDRLTQTLACEITLGPLIIKTEASLEQVSQLILSLVKEYPGIVERGITSAIETK